MKSTCYKSLIVNPRSAQIYELTEVFET